MGRSVALLAMFFFLLSGLLFLNSFSQKSKRQQKEASSKSNVSSSLGQANPTNNQSWRTGFVETKKRVEIERQPLPIEKKSDDLVTSIKPTWESPVKFKGRVGGSTKDEHFASWHISENGSNFVEVNGIAEINYASYRGKFKVAFIFWPSGTERGEYSGAPIYIEGLSEPYNETGGLSSFFRDPENPNEIKVGWVGVTIHPFLKKKPLSESNRTLEDLPKITGVYFRIDLKKSSGISSITAHTDYDIEVTPISIGKFEYYLNLPNESKIDETL